MRVVAGVGCRRGCAAEAIVAVVRAAEAEAGRTATLLAAPAFKADEAGLREAAVALDLPLVLVDNAALAAAQAGCVTRSAAAFAAVGVASVAEGVALAASGGMLVVPRQGRGAATCALAVG